MGSPPPAMRARTSASPASSSACRSAIAAQKMAWSSSIIRQRMPPGAAGAPASAARTADRLNSSRSARSQSLMSSEVPRTSLAITWVQRSAWRARRRAVRSSPSARATRTSQAPVTTR